MTAPATPDRRVVLVTGGSSGIGLAAARAFARRGACLLVAARSQESLAAAERSCLDAGAAEVLAVPTDVTDLAAVEALFDAATTRFGRVDAVIHAAAVVAYGRFDDLPAEVFDRVMATNLTGTANVSRAALRLFRSQQGGSLVLTGSLLGKIAVPYMGSYVTSKWAVHGLARVLQIEARETPDIHVSVVSPGSVNTPAYLQAANYTGWEGRPPPPIDPPEKVAQAIVRAVERPRRDISVGLSNPLAVFGFRTLPDVFDLLVTPLMRVGGLSRRSIEPHPGNVFTAEPSGDREHGPWGRLGFRGPVEASPPRYERSDMTDEEGLAGSATVTHRVNAPPEAVWAVLSDGWMYATWVVGASRVRDVEDAWPAEGSLVHHSFGLWPAVISDTTEVLSADPGRELVLKARGWPAGEAHVRLVLLSDGEGTVVSIEEDVVAGPGRLLPRQIRQAAVVPRNREALRRLAFLVEGRYHESLS